MLFFDTLLLKSYLINDNMLVQHYLFSSFILYQMAQINYHWLVNLVEVSINFFKLAPAGGRTWDLEAFQLFSLALPLNHSGFHS